MYNWFIVETFTGVQFPRYIQRDSITNTAHRKQKIRQLHKKKRRVLGVVKEDWRAGDFQGAHGELPALIPIPRANRLAKHLAWRYNECG